MALFTAAMPIVFIFVPLAGAMQLDLNGERSRLGCSSARPRAEHERVYSTEKFALAGVRNGSRGRGPTRPVRARSFLQLNRSGLVPCCG